MVVSQILLFEIYIKVFLLVLKNPTRRQEDNDDIAIGNQHQDMSQTFQKENHFFILILLLRMRI